MPHRIVCPGEMADRTRKFAWETTPLGPIVNWPYELISTVNLVLASNFPMILWWGPELTQIYNDAVLPSLGDKHPRALGQRGRDCWDEVWPLVGGEIERVIQTGQSSFNQNKLVPILRNGRMEDVYWTYAYSPMRDGQGIIRGVLVTCHDTTEHVLTERRLRTLLSIEKQRAIAQRPAMLASQLVQTLQSNPEDIPFAALYEVEETDVCVAGQVGLQGEAENAAGELPIMQVAASQQAELVELSRCGFQSWPEVSEVASVQPIVNHLEPQYVLVFGINSRLPFDSNYSTFFQLVANRIGALLEAEHTHAAQVAARRKLETAGERLHLAQKAARLGMYYWNVPAAELEWSPEFCDVAGFDPKQKANWEFYLSRVHLHDRSSLRQQLLDSMTLEREFLQSNDHRLIDDDGGERWVTLTGHIHRDEAGAVERIIGTVADITQRKNTEKDLKETQKNVQQQWAELEAIYRTAPIGLALFDPVEFRYLRLNRRQAEIVGLPHEEILGKTLTEIAPIEGLREMFEQVARGEPVINALLEGELPMAPGEHRYWTVNYFPVYDADGTIQAISAASLEITAQKRAELALIQSEKIAAVGRLASSISHEINNPLEAVTNLLYLLRQENLSPDGVEYLGAAERELGRVSQIATHTLRFHRQSTKATETGAAEMIEPILALHLSRLSSAGITVERDYRTDNKVFCFDGEIRQVLNNLVGNSIDAMWRGGRLLLRTQVMTDWQTGRKGLRITIADTGEGMDEKTKRRLFEAFFTTKGIKGTGLGLWISSEIARKNGGRLCFRSSQRAGSCGTVFQLFLPLQSAPLQMQNTVRKNQLDGLTQKAV